MPNGYRRGGTYRRNGKTFRRRGAKIKHPVMLYGVVGAAVFGTWMVGAPIAASPVALGAVVAVGVGFLVWKNRRHVRKLLAPAGRKVEGWAQRRQADHGHIPTLITRTGRRR